MKFVGQALKAIYAAVITFLGALGVVLVPGVPVSGVTSGQWIGIVSAALIAFGGVYGVTNAEASPPSSK